MTLMKDQNRTRFRAYERAYLDDKAPARVWKAELFSWQRTKLMHRVPEHGPFERRMQIAEFDYIASSQTAQTAIAANYVGLPL